MSTGKQEGSQVVIKVLALLALLCGMWAATQFVAWKVNYAPGLGWNIQGVYPPWSVLLWAMEGYGQAPRLFAGAGSIGARGCGSYADRRCSLADSRFQYKPGYGKQYMARHGGQTRKILTLRNS